jgi:putative alpha-1,2-mannosidase
MEKPIRLEAGFIRPKKNGGWDSPFDPREVNNNFTEGNAWQYIFFCATR